MVGWCEPDRQIKKKKLSTQALARASLVQVVEVFDPVKSENPLFSILCTVLETGINQCIEQFNPPEFNQKMNLKSINKSVMKNLSSSLMHLALVASPQSTGAATSAYYASRRASYGRNNSYRVDDGVKAMAFGTRLESLHGNNREAFLPTRSLDEANNIGISAPSAIRELIVVDGNIESLHVFQRFIQPGQEVVFIPSDSKGFDTLLKMLGEYDELDAVHLFSHAKSGKLLLGKQSVSQETLENNIQAFNVFKAIREGGDLLIYGCDLAKTKDGDDFLEIMRGSTHLDVAASNDKTGNSDYNGDWDLEVRKGDVTTQPRGDSPALRDFTGVMQFSGTIDFSEVKTAGSYLSGATSINAEVYTSAAMEYTLVVDGNTLSTGIFGGSRANGSSGDDTITLYFSQGETFDVSSIYLTSVAGTGEMIDLTISSNLGLITSTTINDGFGNGEVIALSGANANGITSLIKPPFHDLRKTCPG